MAPSLKSVAVLAGVVLAGLVSAVPAPAAGAVNAIPTFTAAEIDSGEAIRKLGKIAYDNALARVAKSTSGCTKDNVKIRKEW